MTFNGVFYLETPVLGRVRGAVFLGKGTFSAEAPPVEFELENVRRLLKADRVESDFQRAVLRFSDDTDSELGGRASQEAAHPEARRLAEKSASRLLKETGANIAARVASSVLNAEKPGFFCATFDKGRLGRFTFVLDPQGRVPSAVFGVNAGESGLIFAHHGELAGYGVVEAPPGNDIWMAFHALEDYSRGQFRNSDSYDLVAVRHYDMDIDVREGVKKKLALQARMEIECLADGVQAVPFRLNEGLGEARHQRLKRAMRVSSVQADGAEIPFAQEDWESGFTVFLSRPMARGQRFTLATVAAGDFLLTGADVEHQRWDPTNYYPLVNTSWYPRCSDLARATYRLRFHSKPYDLVAGPGIRSESNGKREKITHYAQETPIAMVTFAGGELRYSEQQGPNGVALEYYSLQHIVPFPLATIDTTDPRFILNDLANSIDYFNQLFGPYPYTVLRGVYQPRAFEQGCPTLLLLAQGVDEAVQHWVVAHEASHQWWGDMVGWRSYRDQWLSEGFAEYSGALYTAARMNADAGKDLIKRMRRVLGTPPVGDVSVHKGRIAEIGPIILGHRLASSETRNAYQALIYEKGALVLRMLHFLLSDPQTGDDRPFFQMLTEFVERNKGQNATTDGFREVASSYFARSPIGRQCRLADLNWFFRQWVYEAYFPSYRMEYQLENQPGGGVILRGTLHQENAGEKWFMPLPVVMQFENGKIARSVIYAYGEQKDFALKLPAKPSAVQLDPDLWILSETTVAAAVH